MSSEPAAAVLLNRIVTDRAKLAGCACDRRTVHCLGRVDHAHRFSDRA